MARKVIILVTNYGLWAEELQSPWDAMRKAGIEVTLSTYFGKKPLPLKISMESFIDPLQGYDINPPEVLKRCKEILDESDEWDYPIKTDDAKMEDYDAIVIVGGSGAPLDICNHNKVHSLILEAVKSNKLVATLCYGVCSLAFTRDPDNNYKSVVYGKTICAHPRAWDFYGSFSYDLYKPTPDNKGTDLICPGFNIPAQPIIEDAVGPNGKCIADEKANRENPCLYLDWPFLTALSVESSIVFGEKLVETILSK